MNISAILTTFDNNNNLIDEHIVNEGDDVASVLGITKYEPVIPTSMSGDVYNAGRHLIVNFDVENYKKYPSIIKDGTDVVMTEKLHGCADYDTIVNTIEYGDIKIGDLVTNRAVSHIASFDTFTGEIVYNLVVGFQELPNNNDWYELETDNGILLKLTGNHPVWLPELHAYRRVDELKGTEKVLIM